jgi:16S rRNA (uracil1498-N3)-methyltransferase
VNLLLLSREDLGADGVVTVSGRRARHLREVLKVRVGQELRVGTVRGASGTGRVRRVADDEVSLDVTIPAAPARRPAVSLVLAVPRPKALSRVLQCAASCGVDRIDLVNAWRVDKGYLESDRLAPERLSDDLWLGCEQGAQTWLPAVRVHRLFRSAVEEELPCRWAETQTRRLVAHPHDAAPVERVHPPGADHPTIVAIGPEGGWIDAELGSFERVGFERVRIGEGVLRVESAVPAILGQLELLRRMRVAAHFG